MRGAIRTITGDLSPGEAGPTFAHEHLIIDSPLVAADFPGIHLPSVSEAIAEVQPCVRAGVRTMVDAMPAGGGRDPMKLVEISVRTGMRIVAATGLHTDKYYRGVGWAKEEPAEDLATRFVDDIEVGIDLHDYRSDQVVRTEHRAGVIKVAAPGESMRDRDLRLFQAAAIACGETGAPILAHTEGGLGGMNQVDAFRTLGVPPNRIALSHTDKVSDPSYHADMLSAGVFLCYDQALRWEAENVTADLVLGAVEAGYGAQILLGTDGARRDLWTTLGGGPGLAWLHTGFVEILSRSLPSGEIERLFVTNPAHFLTFSA